MSNPIEIEWQALITLRVMPSWWRRPTFNPLASTIRRAETVVSLASVILCRSGLVSIDTALAQTRSTFSGISSRIALTRES